MLTRRDVLHSAAALGGLAAVGIDRPHGRRERTFALVHGGWSSGFNYHGVLEGLVTAGHRAVTIDLPGHGQQAEFPASYLSQDLDAFATEPSPSAGITLDACVHHVIGVVTQIARRTGPVILAGHSSGGIVIGKVANAIPHLIDRLVYMAAYMVVERASAVEYFDPRPFYPNVDRLGVLRVNWRSAAVRASLKPGLFPLHSDPVFTAFANTWQPDFPFSLLTAESRVDARTWGRVPRTYVRFTDDGTIAPEQQDAWIAEADALTPRNRTEVRSVPGGHVDPFASPDALVRALVDRPGRGRA